MTVRQIFLLVSGALLIGSCSDKNLALVEKDDMYFTRKDRKELYALNNVPKDELIAATTEQPIGTDVATTPQPEANYNSSQNPDYLPGYYVAPQDGGTYDPNSDQQYYVEGYNQTQQAQASTAPGVTNNYYYGSSYPSSPYLWAAPRVSLSFGIGFGSSPYYSPYYSPFYSSYNGFYDPWYYSPYYSGNNYYNSYYGNNYSGCPSPYYGSPSTVIVNNDNGSFQYADGQYAVTAPRRSRGSVTPGRFVATTSTERRTSSEVVKTVNNGRLASCSILC